MKKGAFEIAYLAKCRSCDLSMPLPLVELCRHDVTPKQRQGFVMLYGFWEFPAGTEYSLLGGH